MAIDIFLLIAIGYGFYVGQERGIVKTFLTAIIYLLGIMGAFKLAPIITSVLFTFFKNESPMLILSGFAISFLLVIIVARLINKNIEKLLQVAHVNTLNKIVGGLVLAMVLVLFYSVLVWFADEAHLIEEKSKSQSVSYDFLITCPSRAKKLGVAAAPLFEGYWDQSEELLEKLKKSKQIQSGTKLK
ncbi:MAG: CvpA family protein [Saprospiraceae bacterium]